VRGRGRNKIGERLRAFLDIGEIENALGKAPKKSRHPVFRDISAGTEQGRSGRETLTERDQIVLVSTRAMKQEQRRSERICARNENMVIRKFHLKYARGEGG
jgi:hypothetical protein